MRKASLKANVKWYFILLATILATPALHCCSRREFNGMRVTRWKGELSVRTIVLSLTLNRMPLERRRCHRYKWRRILANVWTDGTSCRQGLHECFVIRWSESQTLLCECGFIFHSCKISNAAKLLFTIVFRLHNAGVKFGGYMCLPKPGVSSQLRVELLLTTF